MTADYGTYRLIFEPPSDQLTPSVEMTLSGEANVSEMLSMFESFLQASGYVLKGEVQISEQEPSFAGETSREYEGVGFIPFSSYGDHLIHGGAGTDTISFGAAQSVSEHDAKTWGDVISFS